MKLISFCCILGIALASVQGLRILEQGKEFEYDVEVRVGAGTMDYAPHSAGAVFKFILKLQTTSDSALNGELVSTKAAEYVGPVDTRNVNSDGLAFYDIPLNTQFTVNLQANGLIENIKAASDLTLAQENVLKGFLSNVVQINAEKVVSGVKSFKSSEQTIHGECDVSYTVTRDAIYKSMNLDSDCKERPVRRMDDIGGYDCERGDNNKATGLVSTSNTIYTIDDDTTPGAYRITRVISTGAFVAQMFETEGVSYIAMVNTTATLIGERNNPGGLGGGSKTIKSMAYEFSDSEFDYNVDRDLKAREPFFADGHIFENASPSLLKETLLTMLSKQKELLSDHDNSQETVKKAHQFGIDKVSPIMGALDYDSLRKVFDQLIGDKSEEGVMKSNIFTELLGSTGTSASALLVKDLILEQKFDNCRDAARALIAVPFHIRRPNTQLVKEFERLLNTDTGCEYTERALPIALGHLIRKTCMKAGEHKKNSFESKKECAKTFASKYVKKLYSKFETANTREEKMLYLSAIHNIRFGGVANILKPVIDGSSGDSSEMRVAAIWSALPENFYLKKVMDAYFPIYADRWNNHEVRITAVNALLFNTPTVTDMARVVSVLRTETDFEVINFVFTKLEAMASSINPCDEKSKEVAAYFLKYLKQFSQYKASYQFGVSKIFSRQFIKKKYGYSGAYSFTTVGAHDSTTPLTVGLGISSTLHNNYKSQDLFVHLRIEGLAKGLIKKFKTMDPSAFKTQALIDIMKEMRIYARPEQPVRVGYTVLLKGTIAFGGSIEMNDASENGKMEELMKTFKGLGKSINHQRVLNPVSLLVEQPTDIGFPAFYATSIHGMFSLKAQAERKQAQGMLYMDAKYDAHLFIQARNLMMVQVIGQKKLFGIVQDRIYHMHAPRELTIGVNPLRKEVKLSVSRPEKDHPNMFMMHAETAVLAQTSDEPVLPTKRVIVSRGPEATRTRTVYSVDNSKLGLAAKFEYFDCEMDIDKSNTVGRGLYAFMPFNKNPRTPYNSIAMGVRQVSSFLILFPRAEKCGIFASYSQSSENPVRKLELSVRGNSEKKGEKLFLRGSKLSVKAVLKAIGDTTRAYRMTLLSDSSPGGLTKKIKVELDRSKVTSMGIKAYKICFAYFAKYPSFSKEMFDVDLDNNMKMSGKAKLQYGEGDSCGDAKGIVTVGFEYSTTDEARESLKNKLYYKECMDKKNSPALSQKKGLPLSFPCMRTAYDAASARKVKYDIKFEKMTDRMKSIISTAKSIVKAAALPTLGLDAADIDANQIGDYMTFEATLKNDDNNADITIKTVSGTKEIKDYPLRMDWTKRLRNLQYKAPAAELFRMGVLKACQTTADTIYTLDNVTLSYNNPSCYTLMSGHCAKVPSYAVFIKKNAGNLPMAMKAYIGGHEIDIDPSSSKVKVNGRRVRVTDDKEYFHKVQAKEIFKITKWGQTYNIYSFLRVWIVFDGNYVNVVPAPSVKGQHCGLCGNYNRNQYDELLGRDGKSEFTDVEQFVQDYKYKC